MAKLTDTVKNIFSLACQDLINLVHIRDHKKYPDTSPKAEELLKTGYLKVTDFLPAEECDRLYKEIIALTEKYKVSTKLENGTFISYRSADTTNGPDKGMIDIYNVDHSVKIDLDFDLIEKILKPTSTCRFYLISIHAYVNRDVEGTRIFHVDNCQPVVYKGFVYLTNVNDADDGPYVFVNKTHRFSGTVYWNLIRNLFFKKYRSTDMPLYNKKDEIVSLGKKGSLIISNQNGIHRGYPQKMGRERVALVLNYMVVSKLNYIHSTAKTSMRNAIKQF